MRSGYIGWAIDKADRATLLGLFPPAYPDKRGRHVTHTYGVTEDHPLPLQTEGTVVGVTDDGTGIQALVVQIGNSVTRPDGKVFHLTWSLDSKNGYSAKDSNTAIRDLGWRTVPPVRIRLTPKFYPMD